MNKVCCALKPISSYLVKTLLILVCCVGQSVSNKANCSIHTYCIYLGLMVGSDKQSKNIVRTASPWCLPAYHNHPA